VLVVGFAFWTLYPGKDPSVGTEKEHGRFGEEKSLLLLQKK
jgi:hypothetical protein